jgi:hypothetical protein
MIGGLKTCLGIVGGNRCRFLYSRTSDPINKLINIIASGAYDLEIVRIYTLDLVQRWYLDKVEKVHNFFSRMDNFVKTLFDKCKKNGILLLLYSDHGYDATIGCINLGAELKKLGIPEDEYAYFTETIMIRFWFFTERARFKITEMLKSIENTRYLSWTDLKEYNLSFPDPSYGEAFSMTHPGYIFFPHDFYHPIANLYLGLIDSKQRPRLINPKQRGDHTLLPQFDASKGFMILCDENYKATRQETDLIDVAPSVLQILGYKKPEHMKGSEVFTAK